jgi:hypothetical protein
MAKDDDPWKRFRDREDEREEPLRPTKNRDSSGRRIPESESENYAPGTDRLTHLLQQIEPMIEQLNNLYNQYLGGVDKFPPIERRKQLERLMEQLQEVPKPTQASQFRANSIRTHFQSYRDRWDRLLRDLEAGKIKRRT